MNLIKRLLIILVAVAAVVGATYVIVQASGGATSGFGEERGNRPEFQNFAPEGQPQARGQFSAEGRERGEGGEGGGWGQVVRNLLIVGFITTIVIAGSFFFGWFHKLDTDGSQMPNGA